MNFFKTFEELPWILGVLLVIGFFILFTVMGIFIVRKYVSVKSLKAHHDAAGFIFANIGVLYGVLLGFTVVNVQQRFDTIKENSKIEASYLAELYRDSEVFPEKHREEIRDSLRKYGKSVVEEEWDMLVEGKPNPNTTQAVNNIWHAYYAILPADTREQAWYALSIDRLNHLMKVRLSRILGGEQSLGDEMWTLLICGGLALIVFIWFFGFENVALQILMGSILAGTTAFLLFLIYSLDTAFSGDVSISSEAFENVLKNF